LFGPAPQSAFDEGQPSERMFAACVTQQPAADADIEAYLARQLRYDPDVWVVEVDDRAGRHFLDRLAG
jgi:hypothetical protein